MSLSRRKFLQAGAVAAIASGTPLSMNALASVAKTSNAGLSKTSTLAASSNSVNRMSRAQFAAQLRAEDATGLLTNEARLGARLFLFRSDVRT